MSDASVDAVAATHGASDSCSTSCPQPPATRMGSPTRPRPPTTPGPRQQFVGEAAVREAPALLAYFNGRVQEPADAADLVGDVLLAVWRRADAMPMEPGPARSWIFNIARQTLSRKRRSTKRRDALDKRLQHQLLTAPTSADLTGRTSLEAPDPRIELLTWALTQLNPVDRQLLTLIHWEFLTMSEAAQRLQLSPSAAHSRYGRTRMRLQRLIDTQQTA